MNFVSFSPHFPPNYFPFCTNLRKQGVNVLGLADASYSELRPELKASLTEYYRVSNPDNYDELVRAMGYFIHRYGKIDRLESHNEYWLESDARLRTDFNISGFHTEDMAKVKRKSEMKKMFIKAGIPVAHGRVVGTLRQARNLAKEIGFPLIAKPDVGVGASQTHKLHNFAELEKFISFKPPINYIFEEFIQGRVETFDGLVDQNGKIVFFSSLVYNEGVMELVNQSLDFWYHTLRIIPADLEEAGKRLVEVYGLRERFFHFEFFRTPEGRLVGLEVNMRTPGGLTTDMWNYANDIDVYREYANIVVRNQFEAIVTRPYHCAYIGRRLSKIYAHSHEEVLANFKGWLVHHEPISGIFAAAIGDYGYLVRSPDLEELSKIAGWVLQKA